MTDAAAQNTTSEIANDFDIANEIANKTEIPNIITHKQHGLDLEIADESPIEIPNTIDNKQHGLELEIDNESPTKRPDESPNEILKLEIDDENPTKRPDESPTKSPTDDNPTTESSTESNNGNSTANEIEDVQETNVRERTINDELITREVNGMKRIDSEIEMNPNPESKLERNNYSDIAQSLDF